MSTKYKFGEKTGAYFVSFATINWIDVFTRDIYFWNIIESLDFCRLALNYTTIEEFNNQINYKNVA